MNKSDKVEIRRLPTGVPGLDTVLDEGLPELSFNIIGGLPGTGKSTLAHQIMFANAAKDRPALYFTVLGEPALKMMRYQQQFDFFDASKLNNVVRFRNLSQTVLEHDLGAVQEEIVKEVEASNAGIVIVDSFRTVVRKALASPSSEVQLQAFIQRLALHLASWQVTSFLVGEYGDGDLRDNAVFTVADGVLWLSQSVERNSVVRKLQVIKMRGQVSMPGLHTFRIAQSGLQVFPRTFGLVAKSARPATTRRLSTGIPGLDDMMRGGIPAGDSVLVSGPSGSGKTVLATQFIAEGLRNNEPGVIAIFEERPQEYVRRAAKFGIDMDDAIRRNSLKILYLRPLDLSVDETLHEILTAVEEIGAHRVVIDSLAGFELALAPAFRDDFRESLYRMITALTGRGITVLSTVEVVEAFTDMRFSPRAISFLTEDIIRQRYVEIDGQLRKAIMVAKMRGGNHSKDIREYEVSEDGLVVGARMIGFQGLTTGVPRRIDGPLPKTHED